MSEQGAEAMSELRRVVDRQAITELLFEYCYRCDLNDPDGIAACFTEDCLADYGPASGPVRGAGVRRDEAARDLALFQATNHLLSNIVVEFDSPDRARAKSVVHAWHRPKDAGPDWNLRAQYHDVLIRTPDGWRIAERRLVVIDAENFPEEWEFHRLGRQG